MAGKRTLEDGLSILRAIARSDAFKEMRERFRDGAERIADNDKMPRIVAGSAGIVAALLTDPDREHDPVGPEADMGHMDDPEGKPDLEGSRPDDDVDVEEEADAFATVRDLGDTVALEGAPFQDDDAADTEPPDNEDRLLKFESEDEHAEAQEPAIGRTPSPPPPAAEPPSGGPSSSQPAPKPPASNAGSAPVRANRGKEAKGKPQAAPSPKKRARAKASSKKEPPRSSVPPPKSDAPRAKAPRATKTPRPPRGGGRAK